MNSKLTAYALNELPPDERAALEAQMKNDPALRAQAEEMKAFCAMLDENLSPPHADELTGEQRHSVMRAFESPQKTVARRAWPHPIFLIATALAACVVVMLVRPFGVETKQGIAAAPRSEKVNVTLADAKPASSVLTRNAGAKAAPTPIIAQAMPVLQPIPTINAPTLKDMLARDTTTKTEKESLLAESPVDALKKMPTPNGALVLNSDATKARQSEMPSATPADAPTNALDKLSINAAPSPISTAPTPSDPTGTTNRETATITFNNNAGVPSLTKSGGGTLTLNNPNNYSGATTINAGTLNVSTPNMIADSGSALKKNDEGALVLAGVITGSGGVALKPNQPMPTAVASSAPATVAINAGASLDLRGSNTLNSLTFNGGAIAVPNVRADNTLVPFAIVDTGTTGAGTLSLGGSNTFTGGTMSQPNAPVGTVSVGSTSGLAVGQYVSGTAAAAAPGLTLTGGTSLTKSGAGALDLNGNTLEMKPELSRTTGAVVILNHTSSAATLNLAAKASSVSGATTKPNANILLSVGGVLASTSPGAKQKALAVAGKDTTVNGIAIHEGREQNVPVTMVDSSGTAPSVTPASPGFATYTASSPAPAAPGTQTYRPIIENPFTYVTQEPLSTFSLDVDTASYSNVRRFLNSNQRPPGDAVRLEELINYFPYSYAPPTEGKPFAVQVDMADAPWQPLHRIARIALKAREVNSDARAPANFVFLLDVSGSMEPRERLPLIKQALRLLVEQLHDDDRVAIVTYAGESGVALESTPGSQKEKIVAAIEKLNANGSTNGASGIRMAYEQAAINFDKAKINRIILCTDGDFNVGTSSVQELERLIAEKAKSGVFLSVLGVGTDNLHDHTMQVLADRGNGNYHYLDSIAEARKVLVEQMTGTLVTVAKDVKVQVEFNPAQVAAYRLIGYEKRMLAKQDFNNDKKDAGDIGAGHTVTALYEIVPASVKYPDGKPLVDDLKYAPKLAENAAPAAPAPAAEPDKSAIRNPQSAIETMTVKLRYKAPDGDKSTLLEVPVTDAGKTLAESAKDFQFAVSVAGFGMLLRDSQQRGELTWDTVRELARNGKGEDENGYRGEFLQLIEKARGICERR